MKCQRKFEQSKARSLQNRTVAIRGELGSRRSCQILPRPSFGDHWNRKLYWFSQNFLFDQQKRSIWFGFDYFFTSTRTILQAWKSMEKNTHLCTLDVERNNNVKFSEILVSFSNEKRINGKQNYFYLSYLCHRKKTQFIYIISNWFF